MSLEQQLIFLFSAIGALNGFAISAYFLFKRGEKRLSDYFLGGLLFMMSMRVIKSVFRYFNPQLFETFIELGLTACFLIGPFLYLYIKSMQQPEANLKRTWWWHIVPFVLLITIFRQYYSYYADRQIWGYFIEGIYKQWMVYIFLSAYLLLPIFKKLWKRQEKVTDEEVWLLNIFFGVTTVWLAYENSRYTSYIVGALSFTFLLYISILLWFYKRYNKSLATDPPIKYANSSLTSEEIIQQYRKLDQLMQVAKPHLDPSLTIAKLSEQLGLNSKELSQIINQSTDKNYSQYIAQLRIEEAKRLLTAPDYSNYKIAAIAYESGFNSLSSFNAYFKKLVGKTAQAYRKQSATQ
ncbi:MAG: AraC family transcriptional regulator [Bacteroidota bacterium]